MWTGLRHFALIFAAMTASCGMYMHNEPDGAAYDLIEQEEKTCANAIAVPQDECPNQSTVGLYCCAKKQLQVENTILAATFEEVLRHTEAFFDGYPDIGKLAAEERDLLRLEQKAWSDFRETHCQTTGAAGFVSAGTMYPVGVLQCMVKMTQERIQYLRGLRVTGAAEQVPGAAAHGPR